jgi:hypothetical protein
MAMNLVKVRSFVWHDQPELLNHKRMITKSLIDILNFPTILIETILMDYVMEVGKYSKLGEYKKTQDDSKTISSMVLLNGIIYVSYKHFSVQGNYSPEYDEKFRMHKSVMNIYSGTHVSIPEKFFKENDQNIAFLKNDHVWICYDPGNSEYTTISKINTRSDSSSSSDLDLDLDLNLDSEDLILSDSGFLQFNHNYSIALIKNMAFTYNPCGLHISHQNLIKLSETKNYQFSVSIAGNPHGSDGIRFSLPEKVWKISNINDNLLVITNRRFIIYDPISLEELVMFNHFHRFIGFFDFDNDSSALCNNSSNIFVLFNNSNEIVVYNVITEIKTTDIGTDAIMRIVEDQKKIRLDLMSVSVETDNLYQKTDDLDVLQLQGLLSVEQNDSDSDRDNIEQNDSDRDNGDQPNNYLMSADEEFLVIAKKNNEISIYQL